MYQIICIRQCVSDHHKRIGTMLRSTFAKGKTKKIIYHCCNFANEKFEKELKRHLSSTLDFELFHLAFKATLDQFAPSKQNARDDNQSLMIKIFRKAITKYLI